MKGASTGSPARARPDEPPEFVKHPTGLTFRKYILEEKWKQPLRIKKGEWEPHEQQYIQKALRSDPKCSRAVFIDGGAAFGFYSLIAAFQSPCREVQAFNPHPRFAAAMQHNIDDNVESHLLKAPKICLNRLALAGKEGTTDLDFGYGSGIRNKSLVARVPVETTTLDAWARKNLPRHKQILMVKLDIEGAELDALGGATELLQGCRVKYWAIGVHEPNSFQTVAAILTKNGYTVDSAQGAMRGQPNGEVLAHC